MFAILPNCKGFRHAARMILQTTTKVSLTRETEGMTPFLLKSPVTKAHGMDKNALLAYSLARHISRCDNVEATLVMRGHRTCKDSRILGTLRNPLPDQSSLRS